MIKLMIICRNILVLLGLMSSFVTQAASSSWQIMPAKSSINFTGMQNGAPVTGSFKKFSGDILFDLNDLKNSKVKIIVDMNSLTTSYSDLTTTLLTADWFNVHLFPQAIFEASQFTKIGNNQYKAEGVLTIRDKKNPITITFAGKELSKGNGQVKGGMVIKRSMFAVGQGEWTDTKTVQDDVQVNFVITAIEKK